MLAFGRMAMRVIDFYLMTPRQFANKLQGFQDRENDQNCDAWERMRFSTTALINVQLERKDKITPQQLIKLPWDTEIPKREMSIDEFEALIKK